MNAAEIKQEFDKMARCWEEFKSSNDTRLKEIAGRKWDGEPIINDKLDKMNKALDEFGSRMSKVETGFSRFGNPPIATDVDEKQVREILRKDIANKIMRKGIMKGQHLPVASFLSKDEHEAYVKQFLTNREYKTMTVEVDIEGGYLVRPEVASQIQKTIFETSPMRTLCSSVTIGTDAWEMPYDASQPNYGWVGESQSRSVTTPSTFNLVRIPVHEVYAEPQVSQKLLDDASFDVEAYHQQKVAERFARVEATAFVAGTGVFQPMGILSYSLVNAPSSPDTLYNQIEYFAGTSSSSPFFGADDIIGLQNLLYEDFQRNASFLMHRLTAGQVRKLKDSQNRYLWAVGDYPGLINNQPETLLGRPVYFGVDVPSFAASANSIIYGDFKAGYQIVDRIGIRVLRDPYTTKGFVLYYTTKRVGGGVVQFQAFKVLKLHS